MLVRVHAHCDHRVLLIVDVGDVEAEVVPFAVEVRGGGWV
jgi:hypothetical protein